MDHLACTSRDACAFRVAAALERYQAAMTCVTEWDSGPKALHALADSFRVLRLECAGLPVVNVSWAALLISHFELLSLLAPGARCLRERAGVHADAQLQRHHSLIDALARECRSLMRTHRRRHAGARLQSHLRRA